MDFLTPEVKTNTLPRNVGNHYLIGAASSPPFPQKRIPQLRRFDNLKSRTTDVLFRNLCYRDASEGISFKRTTGSYDDGKYNFRHYESIFLLFCSEWRSSYVI